VFQIDRGKLQSGDFTVECVTNGDSTDSQQVELMPFEPPVFWVEATAMVLSEDPTLVNISSKTTGVQLNIFRDGPDQPVPIPAEELTFSVRHPAPWAIPDAEVIISIDDDGVAHHHSEGFVFAVVESESCGLVVDPFIIATGEVFGDPGVDDVIAVWPPDYAPPGEPRTFGYMMANYPNYILTVNAAYDVMTDLYGGFQPFGGDSQVLALMYVEGHCGGNGNPLQTAPICYVHRDGSPQYNVVVHEMGHNFGNTTGMTQLTFANNRRLGAAGLGECSASLPIIYFEQEVVQNGLRFGLGADSYEHLYYTRNIQHYCQDSEQKLRQFENDISEGLIEGVFDQGGDFDGVNIFCSFFQLFSCGYYDGPNLHGHETVRRFLRIFGDSALPLFDETKVDTYFAAAYSVATGIDMRDTLRFWGFDIDDNYFETILPAVNKRIPWVFEDGFEAGDTQAWSDTGP
jgi:hypothetical protein